MPDWLRDNSSYVGILSDDSLENVQRRITGLHQHKPRQPRITYDPGIGIIKEAHACPCNHCAIRAECDGECSGYREYVDRDVKKGKRRKQADG